jgi:hypothetical protein
MRDPMRVAVRVVVCVEKLRTRARFHARTRAPQKFVLVCVGFPHAVGRVAITFGHGKTPDPFRGRGLEPIRLFH